MSSLKSVPIKTAIYRYGTNLQEFIWKAIHAQLHEGMIVAVTSKIISIAENELVPMAQISKRALIEREADHFLCETSFNVCLTVKHGLVIPSAGIDESNSESGHYILYPKDPYLSAQRLCDFLKQKSGFKKMGVIITDSHTSALRKGVVGVGLSHWGFKAIKNLVGEDDLFGRKIKMTSVNVLDALAVAAVLTMGESSECQPIALLEYGDAEFTEVTSADEIKIPLEEDLYGPLLRGRL